MTTNAIDAEVIRFINESKEIYLAPDGKEYLVIGLKAVRLIARERRISAREVEIVALEQGVIPRRYLRNMGTIGREGQIKLLQSTVGVVGAGGLGGTIIELLARQGIGRIVIIDYDRFAEEDLNRQLMSTEDYLGKYKAVVAARRAKKINSATSAVPVVEKITKKNVHRLLEDVQVVVDGLDNLPSRFLVEEACRNLGIPFVYGTIAGFSGQFMTIFPEDEGLRCIYGPPGELPERGVEAKTGNLSATPTMIAAWQVQEIIKIITGIGKPLCNRLLMLDAREGTVEQIELTSEVLPKDAQENRD